MIPQPKATSRDSSPSIFCDPPGFGIDQQVALHPLQHLFHVRWGRILRVRREPLRFTELVSRRPQSRSTCFRTGVLEVESLRQRLHDAQRPFFVFFFARVLFAKLVGVLTSQAR